jgi:LysM repeat protein
MIRFRSLATLLALVALSGVSRVGTAQSLRGSMASVDRMYDHAVQDGLTFYETTNAVHWAAARGELVQLHSNHGYSMRRVNFPYVRPATLTFVERLADDYERVCDEPLVVTSGVRPESRQPSNSSHRSVHPTGMAVDLHKPTNGRCLTWLRRELLALEGTGVIEATEEHHPAHFHVAVFADDYMRFARIQSEANPTVMIVARTSPPAPAKQPSRRYRVREGDSLWSIAQQHSTSVRELMVANRLGNETKIRAGQTLVIPSH